MMEERKPPTGPAREGAATAKGIIIDKIIIIQDGSVTNFGTKEEIQGRVKMLANGMIHIDE